MTASPAQRGRAVATLYAIHDAFRRDAARLMTAASDEHASRNPAVRAGWETLKGYLSIQHGAEELALWPAVRTGLTAAGLPPAPLATLKGERARLDDLAEEIDRTLSGSLRSPLRPHLEDFCIALLAHLGHEEAELLPPALAVLDQRDWLAYDRERRRQVGREGLASFYPWLLDGAPEPTQRQMLRLLSPPQRFAYHFTWRPRYERTAPWQYSSMP
ncbi:hemerythrin domain-containing protein [Streptomyces sp. NPDC020379]|uniref:hemerythrin domain-containing protein n=1 Tax=Streptomyces sp. NPDC020379 TaxID=3365071 RepID=UPI00378C37FD